MSSKSEEKCDLPKILGTTVIKEENEDECSMLDVTEIEKREPDSIQSPASNVTEVFDKDGTMKSIVFPFTIQSDDKVEILPSTNVWVFKNDFYTIKAMCKNLCSSNRHSKMINFLLSRLIGEENLQYMSVKDWSTLIALPEIILFVVKTLTKGNCLPECTYSAIQMTRFLQGVFRDARRNIEEIDCKKNGGEIQKEEEIVILNDNINEEKTLELYKTYDKITFPYMIPSQEKIELVRGYNVWISRIELETINRKCMTLPCFLKHRTMVRLLFKDLLGTENMRHMSIGGSKIRQETRKYIELPEEIYSAVLSYSAQQCDSLNCGNALFKSHGYHDYVTYILSRARQGISRKNKHKQNVLERKAENEDILFPYMIQSEDKVELVRGSNVWISTNDLCKIEEKCEEMLCGSKHRQMIHYLINTLLGTENLKHLSVAGPHFRTNDYLKLPKELETAVLGYATQKCKASDCDAPSSNYQHFMGSIFSNARAIDESRNSSGSEYNRGEIQEEDEVVILNDNINEEKTLELYKTYDKITFPYMIPSQEKIKLVRGYNVWISRIELETINRKCMTLSCFPKHRTMVRLLFKDLLGSENMRHMSIGGSKIHQETRKYIELPGEIYSAVLSYSSQQCDSLNCGNALFKSHGYHDYVIYILSRARQGISRKNKHKPNVLERKAENEDFLFPYMIQSVDKVELVRGSNVWISKNHLCEIEVKCEAMLCGSKHRQMIHYLINTLLGTENLKYLSVAGPHSRRNDYLKLPKELKTAVLGYATQKCKASDCDAPSSNYKYFMGSIFSNARAIDESRTSSGSEYKNEMTYISNTEENNNFAEGKRDHTLDENNFASTFVKLEINSTQTPTIRKRGHEDEQNDSTIRNKRTKLFENTAIQNLENYCSSSYNPILLNHFHPLAPQNRENYCNIESPYKRIPLNYVPPFAPQNVQTDCTRNGPYDHIQYNHVPPSALQNLEKHCKGSYTPIPMNHVPHFASPNLKNYCNSSYNPMPLNPVPPFAPQNVQTYCNRNGSDNPVWLNHGPPSNQNMEKHRKGSYNQIPLNQVPPSIPQNMQNYCNRISSYNAMRLNNVPTSASKNLEKLCKSSYNQAPVKHGPSSALKNLEKYCNSSFVSIPSNHVSAVANVTGNLYKPASVPPNVGADYYYEAVYNSFLVNYLQTVAENSV